MTIAIEPPGGRGAGARPGTRHPPGFTLIEVVLVVAVVAILAGVVAPLVSGEIDGALVERAQADAIAIAEALESFNVTLGSWPTMDDSGRIDRLRVLITGGQVPRGNPYTRPHRFWSWARSARGDLLGHHLIDNSPRGQRARRYPTSGRAAWRGPYLDAAALDPWGRPYVVNVISGYSGHPTRYRRLWVLSAGPDGAFQTSANAGLGDDVAGDDIGFLIRQR